MWDPCNSIINIGRFVRDRFGRIIIFGRLMIDRIGFIGMIFVWVFVVIRIFVSFLFSIGIFFGRLIGIGMGRSGFWHWGNDNFYVFLCVDRERVA